jgi:hypothetical protein
MDEKQWIGHWLIINKIKEHNYDAIHKYHLDLNNNQINEENIENIDIYDDPWNRMDYQYLYVQRFWSKVIVYSDDIQKCWNWNAGLCGDKYGQYSINATHMRAHRFSYMSSHGPIPKSLLYDYLEVMHICNNRLCVNPHHLLVGDSKQNGQYMVDCSRSLTGELNPFNFYSDETVKTILERTKNGEINSVNQICTEYDMTFSEVHAIFDNRIRQEITKDYDLRKLKKNICITRLVLEEVREIKQLLQTNISCSQIANKYNRSLGTIYAIKNGISYRNI